MTRPYRFPLGESLILAGIALGVWMLQYTFQPATDAPNLVVLWLSGLDIVLCFAMLAVLLRWRLRDGGQLPKSWVVTSVVLSAAFFGWIAAFLIDAERVRTEQTQLQGADQNLLRMQENIAQFAQALPTNDNLAERAAWAVHHDQYAQLAHLIQVEFHAKPEWTKDLVVIDDKVQEMQVMFSKMLSDANFDQRVKDRADYLQACSQAAQLAGTLRNDVLHRQTDLTTIYRMRWQAIAASAIANVFLILGSMTLWVVFDRELRRRGKAQQRLTVSEAHYRSLVEHQADPIAVLDKSMAIQYVNPAWLSGLKYRREDLLGRSLFELIHVDDRPRVQSALQAYDVNQTTPCRLAGDYGVWHDMELQCQIHDDQNTAVVHFHPRQAAAPVPVKPAPIVTVPTGPHPAEERLAELEKQLQALRASEQHHRWLLGAHQDAGSEGTLILTAQGTVLSWNTAFLQMWKLSDETMSAHTWQTVAAHMETQSRTGWNEFARAAHLTAGPAADSSFEMHLEGGRALEVYAQAAKDHPGGIEVVQFHFRDVTQHRELESQVRSHDDEKQTWQKALRAHEDHKKTYESNLKEREKHAKHLEKQLREREERLRDLEDSMRQREDRCRELEASLAEHKGQHQQLSNQLRERDRQRAELEADLRDHQERLHHLHEAHQRHADNLNASKESMRRLANGIASDFNKILSVVLGNADVLHESLPKDHLAQTYVDEIKQAAGHGTELSQRLLAFSRNHVLQMVPVDMNRQLSALDGKIRETLGNNVELHWEYANQELWVKTDPHPLEQAVMHVITHAHQHMPKGGLMTIRTGHIELNRKEVPHADMTPGAYVEVVLEDTGDGMDEEAVEHVFEPYHPTKEGQKGDLTLATAYGIIRQSGGCIEVESKKGHGTEWTILLPSTTERPQQESLRASA